MKVKGISYKVHPNFFNNYLEPNRKLFEKKFNISISQIKLTEMLANKINFDNKYMPKRTRRRII